MSSLDQMYRIIQKPVVTEKANSRTFEDLDEKVYHFAVPLGANKVEIRQAVEKLFSVKVVRVNTLVRQGKAKRRGWASGESPTTKRAMVTVAKGSSIEIL
ncbi:MAG: 50S ribosomal protein L23 [Planctomycetes bacterium]|jgi:large subunit ribosomal protein L23|nr:50S ribosomal protein L23 [Planctomycetota bacterium]